MCVMSEAESDEMDTDHDMLFVDELFLRSSVVAKLITISCSRLFVYTADTKLEFNRSFYIHGSCREHFFGSCRLSGISAFIPR